MIACIRSTGQIRNASSRAGLRTTSVIQEERSTGSGSSGSQDETDGSSSGGEASGSASNTNSEESDGGTTRPRKSRRRARRDVMGSPVRSGDADRDGDARSQNSYDDDDYVVVESDHEVFFAAADSTKFSLAYFKTAR